MLVRIFSQSMKSPAWRTIKIIIIHATWFVRNKEKTRFSNFVIGCSHVDLRAGWMHLLPEYPVKAKKHPKTFEPPTTSELHVSRTCQYLKISQALKTFMVLTSLPTFHSRHPAAWTANYVMTYHFMMSNRQHHTWKQSMSIICKLNSPYILVFTCSNHVRTLIIKQVPHESWESKLRQRHLKGT